MKTASLCLVWLTLSLAACDVETNANDDEDAAETNRSPVLQAAAVELNPLYAGSGTEAENPLYGPSITTTENSGIKK